MKLTFLGTRGYIDARNERHRRHTATLVEYRGRKVMIDCGTDWAGRLRILRPDAILITHAHPDHAFALRTTEPHCPVYATAAAWRTMAGFPVPKRLRRTLTLRTRKRIANILFEAFRVTHSLRAPTVGYRVTAGRVVAFYVPDVLSIPDQREALLGARLYIGDGASLTRPIVRRDKTTRRRIGHASVREQLEWCRAEGVPRVIITHCGTTVVTADERALRARISRFGHEFGIEIEIARDGKAEVLR